MVKDRIYAMDIQPLLGTGAYRSLRERLTPERRQKADNYIFEKDRLLSAAAGLLLDRALNDAGVTDRRVSFGENGKPHLASRCGVHFNISHTGTLAVCAVSDARIGIDAEMIRSFEEDLARHVFDESEREAGSSDAYLTTLWTVKESVTKYFGTGLSLEPSEITADLSDPISVRCGRFDTSPLCFTVLRRGSCVITVCSEHGDFAEGKITMHEEITGAVASRG